MPDLPEKIQKYAILEKLEESNYAIIYKAQAQKKEPIVLKISRTQETNELITREFLILSQFKHPNIIPVFDYGVTDDGKTYFTLEYIPEQPLNSSFKGYSEEFLAAIVQVVNALGAFHNKGFIHCDLKPEHILYNRTRKQAIIIDFGFAQQRLVETSAPEITLAGTMGYMAPEVLKGVCIDQRSDLYSLGVIIYEIIAGTKPKDPYEPLKGIPDEFNKLISRLVSKEPALRPSAPELYQTLSKYLKTLKVETLSYKVALPETGFVELPEIMERLSSAHGETLIIQGDTGSGKTRLLQELKYKYLMKGYAVLYYLSREKTHLHETLQSFINMKSLDLTGKEDKFQIFEEITEALITYAKDKPVIIMVDDLEGLSDYSLRLFRYIGYGLKDTNIVLLGTSHGEEQITALGFETLSLRPFNQVETQTLLDKTFFEIQTITDTATQKTDFAQWLHKQSGGNPLFIVEIFKTLYENNIIHYEANKWQIKADILSRITIPTKLDDILESRLQKLDDTEMKILRVLSLTEYPLELSTIGNVLESDATFGIEHLKALGLIHEDTVKNKRVIATANLILSGIVESHISQEEKQPLSKLLLKELESTVADDKDYAPLLAQLSDVLGEKEKAYKYYETAAKDADGVYDYDASVKYYERLAEYSNVIETNKHLEYLVKLGDLHRMSGKTKSAMDCYNQTMKTNNEDLLRRIYTGLARICEDACEFSRAAELYKKAIEFTETGTSNFITQANFLAYILTCLSRYDEADVILKKSLALSKELHDGKSEAMTLYFQACLGLSKNDFDTGIEKCKLALNASDKNRIPPMHAFSAMLLSKLSICKGDMQSAQEYLDLALTVQRTSMRGIILYDILAAKSFILMEKGELAHALELENEALKKAQMLDHKEGIYTSLTVSALIHESLGNFEEAITLNNKSLSMNPNELVFVCSLCNLSMIFCKKGETGRAKSFLEENDALKNDAQYYLSLALILRAEGKSGEAKELLQRGSDIAKEQSVNTMSLKVELLLKSARGYYEIEDFTKSLEYSREAQSIAYSLRGTGYNIARAFVKINEFNIKPTGKLDITEELTRLKEIGCIYDYAYLKKLKVESLMRRGITHDEIKAATQELNEAHEIFASLGAGLELGRVEKLQMKLYPLVVRDYSTRYISTEYLDIFSKLAELINAHLGDEDFTQNILDLIVKTTHAERGALFIETQKGMKFAAGRNMDKTTIKDAKELSKTVVKEAEKNKIIFAENALSDPNFSNKKSVIVNQIHSLICIPLSVSGTVVGAVYLDSRIASGIFGIKDKDFLVTVSKLLASVIEKSQIFRLITDDNILLKSKIIEEIGAGYMIGKSACMKKVYQLTQKVSKTDTPVLLLGETGTGKGMVARLIHLKSERKNHQFLTINCGTIPETILESELFGHKKGAFTGAVTDKIGLLEAGEGGTVFMDELANTSLSFQAKLLEAIEEKRIRPLGDTKTKTIDVRFLFATSRNLETEVTAGRFREDLFYRINVFTIEIPPLRERKSDIPLLAHFFLERYSKEINKTVIGFAPEALRKLKSNPWPGNVRELQNTVERAVILAQDDIIHSADLGFERIAPRRIVPLDDMKKQAISETLRANKWNINKTAKQLGIGRTTLWRYIKAHDIKE